MKIAICLDSKNYENIENIVNGDKLEINEFLLRGSSYDLVFLQSNTKNLGGNT